VEGAGVAGSCSEALETTLRRALELLAKDFAMEMEEVLRTAKAILIGQSRYREKEREKGDS